MMQRLVVWMMVGVVAATAVTTAQVRRPSRALTISYLKVCKHGLYIQPRIGRYAVMLFCDDAAGSHIGLICHEQGCESRGDGQWGLAHRFWQEEEWASDVTAFAWDANGECLYVSTSEIYGTGDLYALSLSERRATKIARDARDASGAGYSTELTKIDSVGKQLEYSVVYFDEAAQRQTTVRRTLREFKFTPPFPQVNLAPIEAIRQWEFEPVIIGAEPAPACFTITMQAHWS